MVVKFPPHTTHNIFTSAGANQLFRIFSGRRLHVDFGDARSFYRRLKGQEASGLGAGLSAGVVDWRE